MPYVAEEFKCVVFHKRIKSKHKMHHVDENTFADYLCVCHSTVDSKKGEDEGDEEGLIETVAHKDISSSESG